MMVGAPPALTVLMEWFRKTPRSERAWIKRTVHTTAKGLRKMRRKERMLFDRGGVA